MFQAASVWRCVCARHAQYSVQVMHSEPRPQCVTWCSMDEHFTRPHSPYKFNFEFIFNCEHLEPFHCCQIFMTPHALCYIASEGIAAHN